MKYCDVAELTEPSQIHRTDISPVKGTAALSLNLPSSTTEAEHRKHPGYRRSKLNVKCCTGRLI